LAGLQRPSSERQRATAEPYSIPDPRLERRVVHSRACTPFVRSPHSIFRQGRWAAAVGGRHGAAWNCRSLHVQHGGAAAATASLQPLCISCVSRAIRCCFAPQISPGTDCLTRSCLLLVSLATGAASNQCACASSAHAYPAWPFITSRIPDHQCHSDSKHK